MSNFLNSHAMISFLRRKVNNLISDKKFSEILTGRQKAFRNIVMAAACINIILNLLLTPDLGIYGAALAGMTRLVFWNLFTLAYIKRKHGKTIGYLPFLMKLRKPGTGILCLTSRIQSSYDLPCYCC